MHLLFFFKILFSLGWCGSGLSVNLRTKGSLDRFPLRIPVWVAGHTLMFLSLSFSLPSPLLFIFRERGRGEERERNIDVREKH